MRRFGSKRPSHASQRAVLAMIITNRPAHLLGDEHAETLAHSYGEKLPVVLAALAQERARRAARQ